MGPVPREILSASCSLTITPPSPDSGNLIQRRPEARKRHSTNDRISAGVPEPPGYNNAHRTGRFPRFSQSHLTNQLDPKDLAGDAGGRRAKAVKALYPSGGDSPSVRPCSCAMPSTNHGSHCLGRSTRRLTAVRRAEGRLGALVLPQRRREALPLLDAELRGRERTATGSEAHETTTSRGNYGSARGTPSRPT